MDWAVELYERREPGEEDSDVNLWTGLMPSLPTPGTKIEIPKDPDTPLDWTRIVEVVSHPYIQAGRRIRGVQPPQAETARVQVIVVDQW